MVNTPEDQIRKVLDTYFDAYEKLDLDVCKNIWDFSYPKLSWKPTEDPHAMTDRESIEQYLDNNHRIDLQLFRPTEYKIIDVIRPDVAFVFADMVCKFAIPENPETRAAHDAGALRWAPGHQVDWKGTASFVLHKRDDEWRLIHYEDASLWDLVNNAD